MRVTHAGSGGANGPQEAVDFDLELVALLGESLGRSQNLSSGGADSYSSFFHGPLSQGSITVTPLGAVLSELVVRCFAEGTRIGAMLRAGVRPNMLHPGDVITLQGNLAKDGTNLMWCGMVTFPNGTVIGLQGVPGKDSPEK